MTTSATCRAGRRPAAVLVFARAPQPGRVKTRLAARLGASEACAVHIAMVERTLDNVRRSGLPAELWIDAARDHPRVQQWAAEYGLSVHLQRGRDLGARMHNAFVDALHRYQGCLLIGSDCPGLSDSDLRIAVRRLGQARAVIAPSWDGGYVLLGLTQPVPALFDRMPWSTRGVYALTRRRLRALGWQLCQLPHRHDVDRPGDLARASVDLGGEHRLALQDALAVEAGELGHH